MSVSKKLAKTGFLEMKMPTSTKMGHAGEQKPRENDVFENENVDVNEDLAFQGCRNLKIGQKIHEFR